MKRFFRLFAAAAVGLVSVFLFTVAPAAAQGPPPNPEVNVFEVEAKTNYCQGGGTNCLPPTGNLSRLRFADMTVWRFSPVPSTHTRDSDQDSNRVTGQPELLNVKCAWNHYLDASGDLHAYSISLTGATAASQLPFPTIDIDGTASVENGAETSTRAVGSVDLRATDGHGTEAWIHGTQVTNNTTSPFPTLIWGGFEILIVGTVMDENVVTQTAKPVRPGAAVCRTNVQPVVVPGAAPADFESEINDDGDAS